MSVATIQNGSNIPLNFAQGSIPNMGETLTDYFQKMSFIQITKTVQGFEVLETPVTTNFWGILMPFGARELKLIPEGQRAWTYFKLYAQPVLTLQVDDVIVLTSINNKQTRVTSREDYKMYGYVSYSLVQDWTGSGP